MTFSLEWDRCYSENRHNSVWPFSDLVSYVMRHSNVKSKKLRVLELGCGAGANVPFFLSLGCDYHGIEGSPIAVKRLRSRFPSIKDRLAIGDFTEALPFSGKFDLIVDRSSLTHNTTDTIKRGLGLVTSMMRPRARYVGIDWFSTQHSEYLHGVGIDRFTKTGYKDGSFANVGKVHFSSKEHLRDLFRRFKFLIMEHKVTTMEIPNQARKSAVWNFVAEKI